MAAELTTYTFLVKQAGWAEDDPHHEKWIRELDSDAQAELHARRISEDKRGAWVQIKRAGASWGLKA